MEITRHEFKSYALRHLINTEDIAKTIPASRSVIDPMAAIKSEVNGKGQIFIFNFGSIVFWNVSPERQIQEIENLVGKAGFEFEQLYSDEYIVEEGHAAPQVEFNRMLIDRLNHDRAEVIASTLAQSSTMAFYETMVESAWNHVDAMILRLREQGSLSPFPKSLHRQIGDALSMRSQVVRVLHLLDRPDLIWEDRVMDELYGSLRATFDLPERFQALEYKLQLIQQTLELLVGTARDRRLYWLEFAIVFLILFDICFSMLEKFAF
ncbi:MAG: RMD1 family protein [Oligoflexus sp.]